MCMSSTSLIVDASVQSVETREGVRTFTLTQNHSKGRSQELPRQKSSGSTQTGAGPKRGSLGDQEGPERGVGQEGPERSCMEGLQLIPRLYGGLSFYRSA